MYKIVPYHPDILGKVVGVLQHLHGNQHNVNRAHFQWKYNDNPYTDSPLGIVALHNGNVVGFRGYMATAWNKAMVLCAGDTIVHPKHRKRGLSIAMGTAARDEYKSQYDILMNFSGTGNSLPGYLKLGFVPLIDKVYLYKDAPQGICSPDVYEGKEPTLYEGPDNVLALQRDKKFLEWRFKNNKKKYTFYHCQQDCVTISVDEHQGGLVLDYTENDIGALKRIMKHVAEAGPFHNIMIKDLNLSDGFSQILKDLGFKERSRKNIIPVLVRPTNDNWFIDGLDIRKVENWELRGICSDNV